MVAFLHQAVGYAHLVATSIHERGHGSQTQRLHRAESGYRLPRLEISDSHLHAGPLSPTTQCSIRRNLGRTTPTCSVTNDDRLLADASLPSPATGGTRCLNFGAFLSEGPIIRFWTRRSVRGYDLLVKPLLFPARR